MSNTITRETPLAEMTAGELADFLVEQGVDLIIGGHPRVVEDAEFLPSAASTVGAAMSMSSKV